MVRWLGFFVFHWEKTIFGWLGWSTSSTGINWNGWRSINYHTGPTKAQAATAVAYAPFLSRPRAPAIRELKQARFWDADGDRKWAVFPFNLSSHNHIYIAKYLLFIRDDWYKNVGDTTVLARKNVLFRLPSASQKRACLSSLICCHRGEVW